MWFPVHISAVTADMGNSLSISKQIVKKLGIEAISAFHPSLLRFSFAGRGVKIFYNLVYQWSWHLFNNGLDISHCVLTTFSDINVVCWLMLPFSMEIPAFWTNLIGYYPPNYVSLFTSSTLFFILYTKQPCNDSNCYFIRAFWMFYIVIITFKNYLSKVLYFFF